MRKIINGRLFDTDESLFLGSGNRKQLFRTAGGFFFLVDTGAELIHPLTYQQARRWAELHLGKAVLAAYFSASPSRDIIVPLENAAYNKLISVRAAMRQSNEALLNELILSKLENK